MAIVKTSSKGQIVLANFNRFWQILENSHTQIHTQKINIKPELKLEGHRQILKNRWPYMSLIICNA